MQARCYLMNQGKCSQIARGDGRTVHFVGYFWGHIENKQWIAGLERKRLGGKTANTSSHYERTTFSGMGGSEKNKLGRAGAGADQEAIGDLESVAKD